MLVMLLYFVPENLSLITHGKNLMSKFQTCVFCDVKYLILSYHLVHILFFLGWLSGQQRADTLRTQ